MKKRYKIIGEQRPTVGIPYTYMLENDPAIPIKIIRWEVRDGFRLILSKSIGIFIFKNPSLGKEFTIHAYYNLTPDLGVLTEQCAILNVKPLPGPPAIIVSSWIDKECKDIKGYVEYLDDISLSIQTGNIPPGDTLVIQIWEKTNSYWRKNGKISVPFTVQVNERGRAIARVSGKLLNAFIEKQNTYQSTPNSIIIDEYYAEITYYGTGDKAKLNVVNKSEILRIKNQVSGAKNPAYGRKSAVVDTENVNETKIPVKIKLNMYFDGTMGNKYNVELFEKDLFGRQEVEFEIKVESDGRWTTTKKKKEIAKDPTLEKHAGGDEATSSYKQTLTSITNLFDLDLFEEEGRDTKIYIEGVGSIPYGSDDVLWGAGAGWTKGIDSKVTKAMAQILEKVSKAIDKKEEYVEEAAVCVIGFSRGATTSRYFVSQRERIAMSALTSEGNVVFKFVGLFDTVSSVLTVPWGKSNVEKYNLKVGANAQKVVQLVAGDEYRKKFPLTDITSSIHAGVGYEVILPGEHSDIGGGHKNYHLEKDEQGLDVPVPGIIEKLWRPLAFVDKLIEQGWYSKSDIKKIEDVPTDSYHYSGATQFVKYATAERTVWNSYRYIPLGIMIDFAAMYGEILFNKKLQKTEYSVKTPLLLSVRNILHNFAMSNDGAHSVSAYDLVQGEMLKGLRHQYLHLSAQYEGGKDNFTGHISATGKYDKDGNPNREIIEG